MKFFRKLPLPAKLFLLVLLPMVLIVYLTISVYRHHQDRVELLSIYRDHIFLFADLSALATQLQLENRKSYAHAVSPDSTSLSEMRAIRPATDSILLRLKNNTLEVVRQFPSYTFLDSLQSMRATIDRGTAPDAVMHYYSTAIFRVKTIGQGITVKHQVLDSIYTDISCARVLGDMFMYLGMIRLNFYNTLHQRQNNIGMLYGLRGVYDFYNSCEKELLVKARPSLSKKYEGWKNREDARWTFGYLERVFRRFSFDTLYDADQWWKMSGIAADSLRALQDDLVLASEQQIHDSYLSAQNERNATLLMMVLALFGVLIIMYFTTQVINGMLRRLDYAAQKIAAGEEAGDTGVTPPDVMGSLARSIRKIDRNNKALAFAASEIGKRNFDVGVVPRGENDTLGFAIRSMKEDLQRSFAELKEHERRKDDFIIMASHELKTPITSIKGYVQLLFALFHEYERTGNLPSEDSVRGSLTTIEKQIDKLTRLLSELLDLSQIERGNLRLERKTFNLSELVSETVDEARHAARERQIIFDNAAEEVLVDADRDRIGQVVLNLITNAIKYSDKTEPVKVKMEQKDGQVFVTVIDQGIGIPQKDHQRIFERFYRVEGKREQTYPGFGVGLYIANEIITRHGGRLSVKSEAGRGSEFTFALDRSVPADHTD
jgi:signal transduction histidine kinase